MCGWAVRAPRPDRPTDSPQARFERLRQAARTRPTARIQRSPTPASPSTSSRTAPWGSARRRREGACVERLNRGAMRRRGSDAKAPHARAGPLEQPATSRTKRTTQRAWVENQSAVGTALPACINKRCCDHLRSSPSSQWPRQQRARGIGHNPRSPRAMRSAWEDDPAAAPRGCRGTEPSRCSNRRFTRPCMRRAAHGTQGPAHRSI